MNNNDYQDLPCVSSHWLIDMLVSPAHCYRRHLDPARVIESSSDALRLGSLVHCLALTPRQFEREFRMLEDRRTRAGKAEWSWTVAQGWTPIKPAELEKARAIVAALNANKKARKLLRHGKKERTIIQTRANGLLPLKARLDIHDEARRHVVELKTTWNLDRIEIAMERYRYPLSAAFYRDMVRGQHTTFVFVQTTPPHDIEILDFSRAHLEEGREQAEYALMRFDDCWETGVWPEAEPLPDFDDDPLMMPQFQPLNAGKQRQTVGVGDLVL